MVDGREEVQEEGQDDGPTADRKAASHRALWLAANCDGGSQDPSLQARLDVTFDVGASQ